MKALLKQDRFQPVEDMEEVKMVDLKVVGEELRDCFQKWYSYGQEDGFGGLVVSILATGTRVRGYKPGRSRWIFRGIRKILSMPSFGGEVK
jgi:hypothetical protein